MESCGGIDEKIVFWTKKPMVQTKIKYQQGTKTLSFSVLVPVNLNEKKIQWLGLYKAHSRPKIITTLMKYTTQLIQ